MKTSPWVHKAILLCAGLIVAVLLLEGLFRLVPTWFMDYRSNLRYIPDSVVGYRLKPSQSECAASVCYKICPIVSNSLGFRDKEPRKDGYDIAVLGDSFMEAAQIPEGLYTSRLIEDMLKVNVVSGAIGGYGTINQLFCYREYMAKYRPSVVLLFFCGNDIEDNSCKTSMSKGVLCADVTEQGEIVITPSDSRMIQFKEFVRINCRSCYGVAKLWITLRTAMAGNKPSGSGAGGAARSGDNLSKNWQITSHLIGTLNQEVKENGGTLVIIPVYVGDRVERLARICRENNIRFLPVGENLERYAAEFKLPEPRFGYRCDGHWNPLGHFLTANIVSEYLLKEHLLVRKDPSGSLSAISANLHRSPVDILGDEAYAQIYKKGFYRGKSRIPEIMAAGGPAGVRP